MDYRIAAAFAGASLFVLGTAAAAQTPGPAPAAPAAESATLGEIVVTARRRAESLQEVPQSVNAVTADTLQKLNITQFTDVQTVVPGLTLTNAANGYQSSASMRGVTFDVNTAAPLPTVATYMNDVSVQTSFMFNSLFDIGQIEVLRGPQGTTRGVSTPSGAITVTTHRPDLSQMGGYVDVTTTDLQSHNVQGAINIPLVKDVLALRVAAVHDETQGNFVRSINSAARPKRTVTATRFSLSFEPNDAFNANLMYQHLDNRNQVYDQVSGPGHAGPDGFVQPPIAPFDRAAVEYGISDSRTHQDLVTLLVDSRIFGQHLSYVGSYQHTKTHAQNLDVTNAADVGALVPFVPNFNFQDVGSTYTTQELRVASDPAPGRFFDYTVGAYYSFAHVTGLIRPSNEPWTQGAFGSPADGVNVAAYNPNYVLFHESYDIPSIQMQTSLFGSVTLHLPWDTELTGGIRHIWAINKSSTIVNFSPGQAALPAAFFGGSCGALPTTYAGFCDVSLPLSTFGLSPQLTVPARDSETANIYNLSLSHHFTRDFLAYVNSGTSFRPGFASFGIQNNAILTSSDPQLSSLTNHPAERTRSYEFGVKWTFWDQRARINADIYRQRFSNFTIYVPNINYVNNTGGVVSFAFTDAVDTLVNGVELDAALQATKNWNIGLLYSYARGTVEGSSVPCNTFGANGTPTFNTSAGGTPVISLCPGGSASRLPLWNMSLTSEYDQDITDGMQGFIRGLWSYYPSNKYMEPGLVVDSYGLLNLFAGVRSRDGAWELSVFARNVLQNETVLDKSPVAADYVTARYLPPIPVLGFPAGTFPSTSGYFVTQVTPPREVGINIRYAWGSR
jgi:iron complex outermembrane receptor protein